MSAGMVILIVVLFLLFGGFRDWGNGPFYGTGNFGGIGLGTVLIVILILILLGRL